MSTPRFSILIPTRNRKATLVYALETALSQTHDDFEVVVMDNHCTDGTTEYLHGLSHPRLRHVRSDKVLPMSENWEYGLRHCVGEYITVLGDDDGLMPEAVAYAESAIRMSGAELVTWNPRMYWWPDAILEHFRNTLYVHVLANNDAATHISSKVLELYYDLKISYDSLPMIYKSFVSRRVIDQVIAKAGKYFCTEAPDLFSGIANCWVTGTFLSLSRPLSVRGTSGRSNGMSYYARNKGAEIRNQYLSEAGLTLEQITHADLIASPNLDFFVASVSLLARDILFPNHPRLKVDIEAVIRGAIAGISRDPECHDDVIRDVYELCAKRGIDPTKFAVPPKFTGIIKVKYGPCFDAQGQLVAITVNGNLAGLSTIVDAVRLTSALTVQPFI